MQAKNEGDRLVCANVCGLRWSIQLLTRMECAALLFKRAALLGLLHKAGFSERRVRPLCPLSVRQQAWQENHFKFPAVAGLRMWESRQRFPSLASARRHLQASQAALVGGREGGVGTQDRPAGDGDRFQNS